MKLNSKQLANNYNDEVVEKWGQTIAYQDFSKKTKDYSSEKFAEVGLKLETIFQDFAICMQKGYMVDNPQTQEAVMKLKNHISYHFYTCTNEILSSLSEMYIADERFKHNIDKHGLGTANYVYEAIQYYCQVN